MTEIDELVTASLLSDKPKESLARNLGIEPNLPAFLRLVAEKQNISEDEAKRLILNSPNLMKLAFVLA